MGLKCAGPYCTKDRRRSSLSSAAIHFRNSKAVTARRSDGRRNCSNYTILRADLLCDDHVMMTYRMLTRQTVAPATCVDAWPKNADAGLIFIVIGGWASPVAFGGRNSYASGITPKAAAAATIRAAQLP